MNLDRLQRFPNQNVDKRPDECVGETVADLIGNIIGQPCDAGFSYAAALKVSNMAPTTAGSVPYSGMLGGLVYGALATNKEPFDATTTSELYEANFGNYQSVQSLALTNVQKGVLQLDSYQEIANYLVTYKQGVHLLVRWYTSFQSPNPDGTLPYPSGPFTNHCVAVYEDTPLGLRVKPWEGPDFGDHGYVYLPKSVLDQVFLSAAGFDPNGWRWWNLAYTGATRPWLINDILPQLHS